MTDIEDCSVSQTDGITVSARSVLLDSVPSAAKYLWGYYLCIENNSDHKIQLVGKDWNITDDKGNLYSDTSAGFKGELPELEPGEFFEFTSEAPLKSPCAVFYGSCKILADGHQSEIKIPTFNFSSHARAACVFN